jgi:hypothetical protein
MPHPLVRFPGAKIFPPPFAAEPTWFIGTVLLGLVETRGAAEPGSTLCRSQRCNAHLLPQFSPTCMRESVDRRGAMAGLLGA